MGPAVAAHSAPSSGLKKGRKEGRRESSSQSGYGEEGPRDGLSKCSIHSCTATRSNLVGREYTTVVGTVLGVQRWWAVGNLLLSI